MNLQLPLLPNDFTPKGKKKAFIGRIDPKLHFTITKLIKRLGYFSNSEFLEELFIELATNKIHSKVKDRLNDRVLEKIQEFGIDLDELYEELNSENSSVALSKNVIPETEYTEKYFYKTKTCQNSGKTSDSLYETVYDSGAIQNSETPPETPKIVSENGAKQTEHLDLKNTKNVLEENLGIIQGDEEKIWANEEYLDWLEIENEGLKLKSEITYLAVLESFHFIRYQLKNNNKEINIFEENYWLDVFSFYLKKYENNVPK
jgi:hypothetical protein